MPNSNIHTKNKILIAGPESELKDEVFKKLQDTGYVVVDFQNTKSGSTFHPFHLLFIYNFDNKIKNGKDNKQLFDEFLDLAQIICKPLSLVVNIDPFLELERCGNSVVFPKKYKYLTSTNYDSVYPIEKISQLIKDKKIKGSIIKISQIYSENYQNQKSIIDYFVAQAVEKKSILLPSNHVEYIHPTHIDDVSFGIIRSIISFKNGRILTILNPAQISISSLAKTIKDEFRKSFLINLKIGIDTTEVVPTIKNNTREIEKSSDKINWSPKSSFIQTISNLSVPSSKNVRTYKKVKNNKKFKKYYIYLTIGLIFIIFAPILFIILNSLSAIYDLQLAKSQVQESKYDEALQRVMFSQTKLNRNLTIYGILNIFPGISDTIPLMEDINHFSNSGLYLTQAFESGIHVARLSSELQITLEGKESNIFKSEINNISVKIADISNSLQLSYLESQKLSHLFGADKINSYQEKIKNLYQISQRATFIAPLIPQLIGTDINKKYLILNLNNNELRPGGGFIGSYSTVDFESSKFSSLKVGDIYDIDGQLKQKIPAPAPLVDALGVDSWYLRDANWDPDFKNNYPVIKEFYFKETGEKIDGVIAVDLEFIKAILNFTGPIELKDYSETVSSENIAELGQKYSEVNFFPGSRQKKNFFSALSRELINEIVTEKKYLEPQFLLVIDQSLTKQSMQVVFEDQSIQSALDILGLTGEVPGRNYSEKTSKTNDYLMVVDANLGANKSNAFLDKKINYSLNLDKNGNLLSRVNIIYKNSSPNNSWPAGDYKNYLRVFVPRGSKLEKVSIDGANYTSQFGSFDDGKLTFFAGSLEVPYSSSKTIEFEYTQPKGINLSEKASDYFFYYQKQAGTYGIEFNYEFNHPDFISLSATTNNLVYSEQKAIFSTTTDTSLSLEFQTRR